MRKGSLMIARASAGRAAWTTFAGATDCLDGGYGWARTTDLGIMSATL